MGHGLLPDLVVNSIFELTPAFLRAAGIRLVLADLDNTLISYEASLPDARVRRWKDDLASAGISLFVVSNSRKSQRCPTFCQALCVPFVRHAGKPGIRGFQQALQQTGFSAQETLMAGDQIFTDIWGANRAGICSVLVKPIAIGRNPLRAVRYAVETPFRRLGRRKEK